MRLTLSQRTAEEEREGCWLRALEAGQTTVPDLMQATGLGRSQVYARLARAKQNRPTEEPDHAVEGSLDPLDFPQMVLTVAPEVESGHWVHLHTGSCSADCGRFNVAGRVKNVVGGPRVEQEKKKSKHKFKPKIKAKAKKCAS
jgi:hypothetical protein